MTEPYQLDNMTDLIPDTEEYAAWHRRRITGKHIQDLLTYLTNGRGENQEVARQVRNGLFKHVPHVKPSDCSHVFFPVSKPESKESSLKKKCILCHTVFDRDVTNQEM